MFYEEYYKNCLYEFQKLREPDLEEGKNFEEISLEGRFRDLR